MKEVLEILFMVLMVTYVVILVILRFTEHSVNPFLRGLFHLWCSFWPAGMIFLIIADMMGFSQSCVIGHRQVFGFQVPDRDRFFPAIFLFVLLVSFGIHGIRNRRREKE